VLSSTEAVPSETTASALGVCLIIDDSTIVCKIARKMLTEFGYEVDEAQDGRTALRKCCERMPDAVLLDWNMPVMNGLDFLIALRGLDGGAKPVVVFCTTEGDVEHIRQGIENGADEYLIKPFDRESLEMKMRMARQQRGL
jgi:two-component system chemotaxis response regulator CheY